MTFTPLASSSEGCAYVAHCLGQPDLLIDAGIPFKKLQTALDFKVSGLAGCLVSHSHKDHCAAVPHLQAHSVDVWASVETWSSIPSGNVYRSHVALPHQPFKVGPWQCLAFEAVHDAPGTLGFLVAAPDGDRLLYLTDSAYSKFRFGSLTHIAIECNFSEAIIEKNAAFEGLSSERYKRTVATHMSLEKVLDFLGANDLDRCKEIHLLHLSDLNSDEEGFKRAVEQATGIPTFVAAKRHSAVSA